MTRPAPEHPVLQLEKAALARWCQGDPGGFLAITAPEITYFDPFLPRRLNGLAALTDYYEALRGQVAAETWSLENPVVEAGEEFALLSFDFHSVSRGGEHHHWHCSEAYRLKPEGWRLVQTHWSLAPAP